MLNKTSLNAKVIHSIVGACREALTNDSGQAYPLNRKGLPFGRVKKIITKNNTIGFEVLDKSNKNIADLLLTSIVLQGVGAKMFNKANVFNLNQFIINRISYPYEIATV